MATSACGAVFDTYELAHDILSYLSTAELARAQRVCSQWRTLITGSEALTRTLFLNPTACCSMLNWGSPLGWRSWRIQRGGSDDTMKTVDTETYPTRVVLSLHPALRYRDPTADTCRAGFSLKINLLARWKRGQWENAFITQPPCFAINLSFWHCLPKDRTNRYPGNHRISVASGVRLGDIRRAICARMSRRMLLWFKVDIKVHENVIMDTDPLITRARTEIGGAALAEYDEAHNGYVPLCLGEEEKEWLGMDDFGVDDA